MFERSGALLERKFRKFLLPTILTSMAISLATVVDSVIVGNLLGEKALSAIGLSGPVLYSLNTIYLLFAVGGVTLASIARGERDTAKANSIFTLSIGVGLAVMTVFISLLLIFMGPICHALAQNNAELESMTRSYLTPMVLVGPTMMLIMGMAQFIRTDGSPKISAAIALVANIVNLILDYILIRFFGTGIAGAAWSTVIGYLTGILMLIPYLHSKNRNFHFIKPAPRAVRQVGNIARTGTPKALVQCLSFLRTLALNTIILSTIGAPGVAALTICINALMMANIFIGGTNDTLLPIVGTLFGEKDYVGIRYSIKSGAKVLVGACAVMVALFLVFPEGICRLFGIVTPEGVSSATTALRLYALSLPVYSVNILLQNFYQTTGRLTNANVVACSNGFVFVVLFALILAPANASLVWLSFLLSEVCTFLVILVMGRRVRRRDGVTGLLLLKEDARTGAELDLSVPGTEAAAAALAEQCTDFCAAQFGDAALAGRAGVAAKELAGNIAKYGYAPQTGVMDVLVRREKDALILRFRDDGVPFDPTAQQEKNGGIGRVRAISDGMTYTRPVGFNSTLVTFRLDRAPEMRQ